MTSTRPVSRPGRAAAARSLPAAALGLAAVAVLAACTGVAASDPAGSTSPGTSWSAAMGSCLRAAGHDVADDDLHEGVVAAPDGVDPDEYASSFDRCRDGLPADLDGGRQEPSAEDVAERQASGVEIAQCVREAGFPDFADPVDGDFGPMSTEESPLARALWDCDAMHGLHADDGADR